MQYLHFVQLIQHGSEVTRQERKGACVEDNRLGVVCTVSVIYLVQDLPKNVS